MYQEPRDTYDRAGVYLTPAMYFDATHGGHQIHVGALLDGPHGGFRDRFEYQCAIAVGPRPLVVFSTVYAGDARGRRAMRALEEFVRICYEHHPSYVAR